MSTPMPEFPDAAASSHSFSFGGYATEPEGLEGVSFWPRAIARVIDYVVHYAVGFCSGTIFRIMLEIASGGRIPWRVLVKVSHIGVPLFVASVLGAAVYHIILVTVHGSSLGKLIFKMVVLQADGSPCRLGPATIREIGYWVDSIFFGLVGYLAMQKTRQEQRYGDQWAETVVCSRSGVAQENLRGAGRFVLGLMLALMADSALLMLGLLVQLNG